MHKHKPDARQLAREKLVFRYSSALERGDFDMAAEVLRQAERDPILEQMIWELHEALRAETQATPSLYQNGNHTGKEGLMTTTIYRAPTHATTRPTATRYRWSWMTLAAAVIALTLFSALLLSGRNFTDPEQDNLLALQGGTNTPTSTPFATFTPTLTVTPTFTPAPIMDMPICQVFNSGPDGLDVRTSPTVDSDFVGVLPPNISADVIRMQANPDDGYTWYLIAFLSDSDTVGGWVRQDNVSEMTDCHEPGIQLGNAIASVVPTVPNPNAGTQQGICQAFVNLAEGIDALSRPSEFGVALGHFPLGTVLDVIDQASSPDLGITWSFVSASVEGQLIQGWVSGANLSTYGSQACPVPAELLAIEGTNQALGIQPTSPEMILTLTALPTCPPEVLGLPSTFTPTPSPNMTLYPFQGSSAELTAQAANNGQRPFLTFTPTPLGIDPIYLTATAVVQRATEVIGAEQTASSLGTPTPTPVPNDAVFATATAIVAQASQLPPTVVPPGTYPCGNSIYYGTPTPVFTPTPQLPYTQWNSVILLYGVDSIPANTPVRVRSGFFNGEEWVYEVETLDASAMGMVRESQLGIVYPVNMTPTAGFDAQLRTGAILLTTEWVGEIPPGTRVQIGSAYYTGSEWIYNVTIENGITSAEAREGQLTPAANFIPGGAMPEPTSPPTPLPSRTPVPTPTPMTFPATPTFTATPLR